MLTTTSEYAIRALIYIAQQGEADPVLAREIAANTGVPSNYISKILRDLAHNGILTSTRGVGGGFRLARGAKEIKLGDIVQPFENNAHRNRCPFGHITCNDDNPCGAHVYYKTVKNAYDKFLDKTSLQAVAMKQLKASKPKAAKKRKKK